MFDPSRRRGAARAAAKADNEPGALNVQQLKSAKQLCRARRATTN
jgi:hypothetical protein